MVIKGASVSIHAAAELVNVEVRAIRQWAAASLLTIGFQGETEIVRLEEEKALSGTPWRRPPSRRGEGLRGRMAGETTETLSVLDLQEKARDREAST